MNKLYIECSFICQADSCKLYRAIVGLPSDEDSTLFMEPEILKFALRSSPSKYKELLVHPLVQLFLHYKWEKIRVLFWGSILFHVM
jgi:hypothetical protein